MLSILRAALASGGVAALAFAAAALFAGPTVSWGTAIAAWGLVTGSAITAGWVALRPAVGLAGSGATRLLRNTAPELVSPARSALELEGDPRAHRAAPDLVEAHARTVGRALARHSEASVLPWARALRAPGWTALAGLVGSGLLLLGADRAVTGAYAMFHLGARDDEGHHLATVVASVETRLVYPGYLNRPPVTLSDPNVLEAPRGTSVELWAATRLASKSGVLRVGPHRTRLAPDEQGRLHGRFIVREDAELRIRVQDQDEKWYADPLYRTVRVLADEAPRVELVTPQQDRIVELREEVSVRWEATDDAGLSSVDLVVRTVDGSEIRHRLERFDDDPEPESQGSWALVPASFGARAGDPLVIWVEAQDADHVSGPNRGRSAARTLTVASEATRRAESIAQLEAVVSAGLDALADRLEKPVPASVERAIRRYRELSDSTENLLERLREAGREGPDSSRTEGLFREIGQRVRRALRREGRAHGTPVAKRARRAEIDRAFTKELETDVLLLADLVDQARVRDAEAIARELERIRREMTTLLRELKRSPSPETRTQLLEAMARADARMRELVHRLAAMQKSAPSEFINFDALPQQQTQDALAALRQAIDRNDLSEAEAGLDALARQIDTVASALGQGASSLAEARFGPRERALAAAMDDLAGLEAEQRELADRSAAIRRRAAEQALAAGRSQNMKLSRKLERDTYGIARKLDRISSNAPVDRETFERARQRLRDVRDALRVGDLGEAKRMTAEAASDVAELSRDLDLSALMFPGARGGTAEAAKQAQEAAEGIRELQHDMDGAIPRLADFLGDGNRQQMQRDAEQQTGARSAARRLARRFSEAPDGSPLAPEAGRAVEQARDAMRAGAQALNQGDPVEASRAQQQAAERLTSLREDLERRRKPGPTGGEERGEPLGPGARREMVRIPGAEEFRGPAVTRRRVLDAMANPAPPGFENSVRRYYQELLR